jgi:hypothetical protein
MRLLDGLLWPVGAGREPEDESVDQVPGGDCWGGEYAHRARGCSFMDRLADGAGFWIMDRALVRG